MAETTTTTASVPRLTYFNGRGKAHHVRWQMAASGMEWEDRFVTNREDFLAWRGPFGQVPTLEMDGKVYVHSRALVRLAARRGGLCGDGSPEQDYECEKWFEAALDFCGPAMGAPFSWQTPPKELPRVQTAATETAPRLEEMLSQIEPNAEGKRFLVGGAVTYADVMLACTVSWYMDLDAEILEAFPLLRQHATDTIEAVSSLRAYIESDRYIPIGGEQYANEVDTSLDR